MFSKIIITMLALTLSAASFGAEESKARDALKYVKEKFEFSYHGEYYLVNNADHDLTDHNSMHVPTLVYKPIKNLKISATGEFKYTDNEASGFPNRFFRALYSITRENILTEKENGIKLDLGLGRRVFDRKTYPKDYGNTRVTANISRALPGGLGKNNGSLFTQYLFNDPKTSVASTWKHGIELIPTLNLQMSNKLTLSLIDDINYFIARKKVNAQNTTLTHEAYSTFTYKHNDAVSPYFQLKYVHGDTFATLKKTDSLNYYIGAGCAVNSKLTLTPELGTEVLASADNRKGLSDKFKYIDFALYADMTF